MTRAGPAAAGMVAVAVVATIIATIIAASPTAEAHPAPSSSVALTFATRSVKAQLLLPVSELTYAMTDVASQDPGSAHIDERALRRYVVAHVSAESHDGAPWSVAVRAVKAETLDDHDYWAVDMMLTPPPDCDVSDLVLVDDAITREIRNHFIFATARASEAAGTAADVVGILQYPASRLSISGTASHAHAARSGFGSRQARISIVLASLASLAILALLAAGGVRSSTAWSRWICLMGESKAPPFRSPRERAAIRPESRRSCRKRLAGGIDAGRSIPG